MARELLLYTISLTVAGGVFALRNGLAQAMRFIGSKVSLLKEIQYVIQTNVTEPAQSFCDIFSGTASVARYFKRKYRIISNDLLHFSYVLQTATVTNNVAPCFHHLQDAIGIHDPLAYLSHHNFALTELISTPFIYEQYSPNKISERQYLTNRNALRIDFARQTIEDWKERGLVEEHEYYYLLAALIEAVPFVSNIAGTYGAYLKHWDNRAHKRLILEPIPIYDNQKRNEAFNTDANVLISRIRGDILYIDPPYNNRQYLPNYHLLETISQYDSPAVYGKTGMRPYEAVKSKYCNSGTAIEQYCELVRNAQFRYIITSYSSEGLMTREDIEEALLGIGIKGSYRFYKIPYRRYKHTKSHVDHNLEEYIFFIQKA